MNGLTVTVRDQNARPIRGAQLIFVPVSAPPGVAIRDALTDNLGTWFTPWGGAMLTIEPRTYKVLVSLAGYVPAEALFTMRAGLDTLVAVTMQRVAVAFSASDLPALISVGSPPPIQISGLPTGTTAYIETTVVSVSGEQQLETPVKPDGTAAIALGGRLFFEPTPQLVAGSETPLADAGLRREYTITCRYVAEGLRQLLRTYTTTALLIDHPNVAELVGVWLPGSFSMQRGTYADALIILPAGVYQLNRQANTGSLFGLSATSDGKTPLRVRMPDVPANTRSLRLSFAQTGTPRSDELTVIFR